MRRVRRRPGRRGPGLTPQRRPRSLRGGRGSGWAAGEAGARGSAPWATWRGAGEGTRLLGTHLPSAAPFVLTHVIGVCDSHVRMRVGVVRPALAPPAVRALDGTPSSGTSQTCV